MLCFPFYLNAQQIEKVEGEILVMVSPGFDFTDFELARREEMISRFPQHREVITKLTRS